MFQSEKTEKKKKKKAKEEKKEEPPPPPPEPEVPPEPEPFKRPSSKSSSKKRQSRSGSDVFAMFSVSQVAEYKEVSITICAQGLFKRFLLGKKSTKVQKKRKEVFWICLLYTSPSPRD